MPAFDVVQRWKGRVAVARDGGSLGTIVELLYDAETDQPGWALLTTGTGRRLVPVTRAVEEPGRAQVEYLNLVRPAI
jgi:hypothetical protein